MYTLLKSEIGAFPEPRFPVGIDLRAEDRRARRRLYPVTIIYAIQFLLLLAFAVRAGHAAAASTFVVLGVFAWIPIEYLAHRHVLHGVFPKRGGRLRRTLHHLLDATHADHHARPWDGMYINGHLATLWVALVGVPLGFLAPFHTLPVWVATLLLCYIAEEWAHHAMHFWSLRWSYFQYIRARHLYHHSRHGSGLAFGVTSGIWDVVSGTRIPVRDRQRLVAWHAPRPVKQTSRPLSGRPLGA